MSWLLKHRFTILGGLIFLTVQLLYSKVLLTRSGNLAINPDDSYSYIFLLDKPRLFESLFPKVPSFNLVTNFAYLSYTTVFGGLVWLLKQTGETIYYSSFYWGKGILLASLVWLLRSLGLKDLVVGSVLTFLAVFTGNGAIHGYFWVVPSFWLLVLWYFLLGCFFRSKAVSGWLIGAATILYSSMHPLSFPLLGFWILLWLIVKFIKPGEYLPNANKVMISLGISSLVLVVAGFVTSKIEGKFFSVTGGAGEKSSIIDKTELPPVDQQLKVITSVPGSLIEFNKRVDGLSWIDKIPNIKFPIFDFGPMVNFFSRFFPSFRTYWQTLVSPWLPIYPMAIWLVVWHFRNKEKITDFQLLFWICGIFSLGFLWHEFGYRTLLFFTPMVFGVLGVVLSRAIKRGAKVTFLILGLVWIYFLRSGLLFVKSNAAANQGSWNPKICVDYLKKNNIGNSGGNFFASQTAFNAFLANGFHDRLLSPYKNLDSVKPYLESGTRFYLIRETKVFEGNADIPFGSYESDLLVEAKEKKFERKITNCNFFEIWAFDDTW